ncbi:transporter [Corynebacterium pseudotuberculosis]|uniref:Transporter n=1 Tax=Corynebacterium pseudotuberculosis 258 TaxID=1168865 RepID=A0AAU8PJF2_CORPS|nr:aspartate:alanine exchanger family transporter [Corynebacterium pseudotuberculosis]AEQ05978.1 transporter [Corynebacterium pseudotuberculosis CIP 52.97]AFK16066.1 transporter [Corynebacterium pseudotuberculosis 258]AKS12772.1 AspT/YidE/YbjL antiporter duplication [Corynebacterium pseudotuberculosis]KEX88828.1 putative transport protein [Corynebacterium pseudotuberculosis]UTO24882.1 transporter [Corynebacterium pseudotuberculosis]
MLDYLATQPLITLVLILALGLALGKIHLFGISLGAAAVLFVALALSTIHPALQLPPLIFQLGLAMFVYAIGLNAGAAFFAEFRHRGWKLTLYVIGLLVVLMGISYALITTFDLGSRAAGAGMFAGAISSTPGMAAMVAILEGIDDSLVAEPVVGYSLAYPGAVIGSILVAAIGARVLKVNHTQDAEEEGLVMDPLEWTGVRIGPRITGTIAQLPSIVGEEIIATRVVHSDSFHSLADPNDRLFEGMVLVINGTTEALDRAIAKLGAPVEVKIEDTDLEYLRVTVSSKHVVGRKISELDTVRSGFIIARLRRGDAEVVPEADDVLHYSDRVRVIAPKNRMSEVRRFLGDSERQLADVDLLPFAIGLSLGLLIGAIPIPLPGGNTLSLGFGGGPIVVGLILGAMHRTGPIRWSLPYHANRTISTFGLAIFLAGVGTSTGVGFRHALTDPSSLKLIAAGFVVTLASALITAAVCMPLLKLKWDEAMGVAAGVTTNPAIISYLNGQTGTELATRGYATVYPTAMIGKIVASQMLLLLLL